MPLLRTDDGPRRLRAVWLGPRGNRFWMEWTYVQWAVFATLTMLFTLAVLIILWWPSRQLAVMACLPWGLMAAYPATKWIMAHADYDRPLKYWRWVMRVERRRSQTVPAETAVRVHAPIVAELPREVRLALYSARRAGPRISLGLIERDGR